MSEAESLGENRNSFVFPLTKMRRKFIISAGTLLDILPFEIDPDTGEEKKKKIKKDEPKREVFGLRKSTFGILNGSSCAFQKKNKFSRSPSAGLAEVPSEEEQSPGAERPEREGTLGVAAAAPPPSSSSAAAAATAAAPGPAAPGGPSRVTHGHGAGWEGVKSPASSPSPAVIHTCSRVKSSLSRRRMPRRRGTQITMWLHMDASPGGRRGETAQLARPGLRAGPRKPALKGI